MFRKIAIAALAAAALAPAAALAQINIPPPQGGGFGPGDLGTSCRGVITAHAVLVEQAGGDPAYRYWINFQNTSGRNLRSVTISFHGFNQFEDAVGTMHRISLFSPSLNITNVNTMSQQQRFGSGNAPNMWIGSGGRGSVAVSFDGSGSGSPRIDFSNCVR